MTARSREAAIVAVIVVASCAGVWAATRDSYFAADDWLNFGLAREHGMSWAYLKLAYFGHFAPVHRLLDWVWAVKLRGDWGAYLALMLALQALAAAATYVLMRALGARVWLAAAATTLFASSVIWVRIIQWPASAEHVAWALTFTTISLAAAALWFRRRSPWLVALSAGAMAVGLLSYEKPALVVLYVVLLRYFVLAPSLQPRALLARARGDWPLLAALGGVALVYAAIVLTGDYTSSGKRPPLGDLVEFFARGWVRGTGSLVIGQGSPEYADPIPLALVILAQLVLATLVVVSIRLRRSAWRAWAFLVVCWFVNLGLIGLNRITAFGPGLSLDPRYNAEMALLLALTLVLAFLPGEAEAARQRMRVPRAAPVIAGLGVALLAASCASAYRRVERSWDGGKGRTWVERVQATAAKVRGPDGRLSVVDGPASSDVIGINEPPFDRLSTVLPVILDGRVDFDGHGARPAVVDADGTVRPARLQRLWGGALPRPACGPTRTRSTVDNGGEEAPGLVRVTVEAPSRAARIPVLADYGAGYAALPRAIRLEAGDHASGVAAEMKGLAHLELLVPAGVCVRGITTALAR